MSKQRYRRPARWGMAIGLPGLAPSREAVQLASAPHLTLPPAVWHIPDYHAGTLAAITPVVSSAVHKETGARFLLASVPDGPVLAIAAVDDLARGLAGAYWPDPAAWAAEQAWQIEAA